MLFYCIILFMIKRFIQYYKPHKTLFFMDMLASFLISIIGMLYPVITRQMLNDFVPNRKVDMVIIFGAVLFVIYLIRMLLRYFVQYYGHCIGVYIQSQMRKDLFVKLQQLPFSFFDEHETGQIMSRMTNDLQEICELAHHGPENIFMSTVMMLCSFIYLSMINLPLTLIIFFCVPFMAALMLHYRKQMRDAYRKSRVGIAKVNAAVQTSISGIRVTKAFDNAQKELEKFEVGDKEYVEARKLSYRAMGKFHSSTSFVTDVFNVIVLVSGGIFLYNGSITFGDYSTFVVSINLFISPLTTLIQFMEQYQSGVSGFERFVEIMDTPIEKQKEEAKDYEELNGDIVFDHVSFAYEDNHEVLNDLSFRVKKGETLALVGPSGGGKTTICHLLPNFYQISEGTISIDGKNISDITFKSLRENIGIVQQDVFLFNGTFYDNIVYGKLNATYDEVVEAAKKANIYDYIMSLEKGFDTEVGERGVRLSGGQKQRISIARVFLKNPSVLILDEATSALDNTTEILIQQALDTLKEGRTTIVVAHRLSTIKNADEILVVTNGAIAEQGTHEELLERKGLYADLYAAQFRLLEA